MKNNQKSKNSKVLKLLAIFLKIIIFALVIAIFVIILNKYNEYKEVDYTQDEIISEVIDTSPTVKDDNQPFSVNWEKIKKQNDDVVAWIRIPNTSISYPVVQGSSNSEYLHKNIYGKYSKGGTPFVDASTSNPFNCVNTIIYGHNLMNGKIFSQLKNYKDKSFAEKHNEVYIYLPTGETRKYKVYSFHIVNANNTNIFNPYADNIKDYTSVMDKNNILNNDIQINDTTQVVTLSTCTNNGNSRYVLHAVINK